MDLVHVLVEYLGESLTLPYGETAVGRDVTCALRFNDPAVSRKHLRFIRRQDEVFVEDLDSSNGTQLNGVKITASLKLEDGDVVRFGSREVTIRIMSEEQYEQSTLTLNFEQVEKAAPNPPLNKSFLVPTPGTQPRSRTQPMAVVVPQAVPVPPVHQRCPKCGAPVTEVDDECPNCRFNWGSFRPMNPTSVQRDAITRKRRHERKPVELPLVYVSTELEIEAVTRDLSESGVFVCSQVLDPVGTSCRLTILVDGGPPVAINGIVRRVVERDDDATGATGLGVEFVEPGPAELAWIRAVIARLSASESDG